MLSGQNIVCLYCERWDTPLRTSKHHLMEHFAQRNRVLYVETPVHPLVLARRPGEFFDEVSRWRRGLWKVSDNLFSLKGFNPVPYHRFSRLTSSLVVNRLNQEWFSRTLSRALDKLDFQQPIFWLYYPTAAPLLDRFNPSLVAVHVVDDWMGFSGTPASYKSLEDQALRRADLVVASSAPLYDARKHLNANTHLVRHGVDADLFAQAADPTTPVPPELAQLRRPVIGYYGAIHKLDNGLIKFLADQRPDWSFVLIGPTEGLQGAATSWANGIPNVHFLGPRPHCSLPGYLKGFDATFFPFKVDLLTQAMCPIKVYECLGSGIPAVSIRLPEIDVLGDLVYGASSGEEFLQKLEDALKEPVQRRRTRMDFARGCTWEERIAIIEGLLEDALMRKSRQDQIATVAGGNDEGH